MSLSHEEIAKRFLQSEAVNFGALGKFVAEVGPELFVNDGGWHGVNFGRFNMLARMGLRKGKPESPVLRAEIVRDGLQSMKDAQALSAK